MVAPVRFGLATLYHFPDSKKIDEQKEERYINCTHFPPTRISAFVDSKGNVSINSDDAMTMRPFRSIYNLGPWQEILKAEPLKGEDNATILVVDNEPTNGANTEDFNRFREIDHSGNRVALQQFITACVARAKANNHIYEVKKDDVIRERDVRNPITNTVDVAAENLPDEEFYLAESPFTVSSRCYFHNDLLKAFQYLRLPVGSSRYDLDSRIKKLRRMFHQDSPNLNRYIEDAKGKGLLKADDAYVKNPHLVLANIHAAYQYIEGVGY